MSTAPSTALSPVQVQVIAALAQGRTVTTAAVEAGIHRNTIYNWLREPAFQAAVEQAQNEYAETLRDLMRDLAARALQTLREILDDPKASPSVRLKAALAILQRPHAPKPVWHLPVPIDNPVEIEANPIEPTAIPIARSAPCPCGSGLKYKRCCGPLSPGRINLPNSAQGAVA